MARDGRALTRKDDARRREAQVAVGRRPSLTPIAAEAEVRTGAAPVPTFAGVYNLSATLQPFSRFGFERALSAARL